MNFKQFAIDNARAQANNDWTVECPIKRRGNSIEWFKCNCGEQSNLVWSYKGQSSSILACSLDCAAKVVKGLIKHHFIVP